MLLRSRPTLALLALLLAGIVFCRPLDAAAQNSVKVFVVHSYDEGYVWTQFINAGLKESLQGLKVSWNIEYMDAKRKPDPADLRQRAVEILERIEALRPQVVIAADDAAQEYLVEPYLKGRASPQVIFCGVNAPPAKYGFPAANVSGVRELWHFGESFALLKKIKPEAKTLALLTDDSESSGYVLDDLAADVRKGRANALKLVAVEKIATFQEWQRKVLYHQARADALGFGIYMSLKDETTGEVVPTGKVMAWTNSVLKKPTVGFADYAAKYGQLCGVLESGHEQGYLAGQMARQVLEQKLPAGRLPMRVNQRGTVLVNLKEAQRLGLNIPYDIIRVAGVVVK